MGKIKLLADAVINRIAAGEVVERPASVVKELIENSLDAAATKITVELEDGGKKSIIVTDNGQGMDEDDAILSLKRHATSKIVDETDLYKIQTMGFRGEALAAISAVSKFCLLTKRQQEIESGVGTKIVMEGDSEYQVLPWTGQAGTTIMVKDIFFNLPARLNFLRSGATEYSYCLELVQAMALCHPQAGFSLKHNGKETFRISAQVANKNNDFFGEALLRKRAGAIFPEEMVSNLLYVAKENDARVGRAELLFSPPGVEKTSARYIFTFVNGRFVKDKNLRYAILRGYQTHLLKGNYPLAILYLSLDPSLVDVNVHPTKAEVKFQYYGEVQEKIGLLIREKIRDGEWGQAPETYKPMERGHLTSSEGAFQPTGRGSDTYRSDASQIHRSSMSFDGRPFQGNIGIGGNGSKDRQERTSPPGIEAYMKFSGDDFDLQTARSGALPLEKLRLLGSFAKCYLLLEMRDEVDNLLVIDQHAFHERIIFERISNNVNEVGESQPLLVPEAIQVSPTEASFLNEAKEMLQKVGFSYQIFPPTTVEIRAVPTILVGKNLMAVFSGLAELLEHDGVSVNQADLSHGIIATIACHAAVRAGEELTEAEIGSLLKEARGIDFYLNCPHGRPVFKWWSKGEIESWFERK